MRFLNIITGSPNKNHAQFGEDFLIATKLGWPDKELFQVNLNTFLANPLNFKYTYACRPVYNPETEKDFGELCTKIIKKAQWSSGPYADALAGITNMFTNWDKISQQGLLGCNFKYSAQSAAIVGAGPSLDSQLEDLRKYKGLIIAVDAVAHYLEEQGINYHLIFSTERQPNTAHTLRGLTTKNRRMLSPFVVHPDSVNAWEGDMSFYAPMNIVYSPNIFPKSSIFMTQPVVGSGAILISCGMGVNNIGLFGYDFSYSKDGNTHTKVHDVVKKFDGISDMEAESYAGVVKTTFVWHAAVRSLDTTLNVMKFKTKIHSLSSRMLKTRGVDYTPATKWRLKAKPGYELKELDYSWDYNRAYRNIKENLNTKSVDMSPDTLFDGPAGSLIRMLTWRTYAIYQSKCWAEPQKKDTWDQELKEEISKSINDLSRIL